MRSNRGTTKAYGRFDLVRCEQFFILHTLRFAQLRVSLLAVASVQREESALALAAEDASHVELDEKRVDLKRRCGLDHDNECEHKEEDPSTDDHRAFAEPSLLRRRDTLLAAPVHRSSVGDVSFLTHGTERTDGVRCADETGGVSHRARGGILALINGRRVIEDGCFAFVVPVAGF